MADRIECHALGYSERAALRRSLAGSSRAFTALIEGRPEAMMGVEILSVVEGLGAPWMLATDAAYCRGRDLIGQGRSVLAALSDSMRTLRNIVSAENGRAIRMLRHWGFDVGHEVVMIGGVAFLTFSKDMI